MSQINGIRASLRKPVSTAVKLKAAGGGDRVSS